MTSDRHPAPVAPEPTPRPQLGNGFLIAGAIIAPCAVLLVATSALDPWLHDVLLFGPGLILIVGIVIKVAERVIAAFQRHVKELMRQQAHVEDEIGEKNSVLAAQLEANNHLLRQLTAQPTVRLEEMKREMREGIRQLGEHIDKAVERGVQDGAVLAAKEVALYGGMSEDADSASNVRVLPNPRIYQLGIVEGERRAREGREKPK